MRLLVSAGFRTSAIMVKASPGRDVEQAPLASLGRAADDHKPRPGGNKRKKKAARHGDH
jgi:hypothetical protein